MQRKQNPNRQNSHPQPLCSTSRAYKSDHDLHRSSTVISSSSLKPPFSSFSSSSFCPSFLPISRPPPPQQIMKTDFSFSSCFSPAIFRRLATAAVFLAAVVVSCFLLYRGAESVGFKIPAAYYYYSFSGNAKLPDDDASSSFDSRRPVSAFTFRHLSN